MSTSSHVGVISDTSTTGAFVRKPSTYREFVKSDGSTPFQPAAGRYLLVVSYACPWACRCLTVRHARGLDKPDSPGYVPILVVHPIFLRTRPNDPSDEHLGWHIVSEFDKELCRTEPDPVFGATTVRELYEKEYEHRSAEEKQQLEPPSRFTVPILVDTKTKRIVNNESSEIIRMFDTEFLPAEQPVFYPVSNKELCDKIDFWNEDLYESISNGVYKCGFARSQEAYDEAVDVLYKKLDDLEAHFAKHRFLVPGSGRPLECDVRLVQTIIRFDSVYVQHFKLPGRVVRADLPNLHKWMVDCVQTLDMYPLSVPASIAHYCFHYYSSHKTINPLGIVPKTFVPDWNADVSERKKLM